MLLIDYNAQALTEALDKVIPHNPHLVNRGVDRASFLNGDIIDLVSGEEGFVEDVWRVVNDFVHPADVSEKLAAFGRWDEGSKAVEVAL